MTNDEDDFTEDPQLAELSGLLDELAAEEESAMAEAETLGEAPGLDRVEEILAAAAQAGDDPAVVPGVERRPRWLRWAPLAAAAAVVWALILIQGGSDDLDGPGPGAGMLGSEAPQLVRPREQLSDPAELTVLQWAFPQSTPQWTYRVRIMADSPTGTLLAESAGQSSTSWIVSPNAGTSTAEWPGRIVIEVQAFLDGESCDTLSKSLEFSSP